MNYSNLLAGNTQLRALPWLRAVSAGAAGRQGCGRRRQGRQGSQARCPSSGSPGELPCTREGTGWPQLPRSSRGSRGRRCGWQHSVVFGGCGREAGSIPLLCRAEPRGCPARQAQLLETPGCQNQPFTSPGCLWTCCLLPSLPGRAGVLRPAARVGERGLAPGKGGDGAGGVLYPQLLLPWVPDL